MILDLVAGARPNFMKLAPVHRALARHHEMQRRIVHTGQHYDARMSDVFFQELGIPAPDVHLDVGSGGHGEQTAKILERYERVLLEQRPAATVVFGDVNSTIACALAAVKLGVPVVHVEAGLRSFDRTMPEEINRILTDAIADLLLVTEPSGVVNLTHEGVPAMKIREVGNVMIDTLMAALPDAERARAYEQWGLVAGAYGLVTLHRPSNVDDADTLQRLLELLRELSAELPLIFPVHPRTREAAATHGIEQLLEPLARQFLPVPPQPYVANLSLMRDAQLVITDSGGMQEETSVLGIPCLTLRDSTERPITADVGTSRVLGNDSGAIRSAFREAVSGAWPAGGEIPMWDGQAGGRIAAEIASWLSARQPA